jgi:hypothetical protein
MSTTQQQLFERAPSYKKIETPASHRADPETSRIAEDFVTRTGIRASQQQRTINAVKRWPGKTSAELARLEHHDHEDEAEIRTMLARRLSECATAGAVRRGVTALCAVKKMKCVTWWPV